MRASYSSSTASQALNTVKRLHRWVSEGEVEKAGKDVAVPSRAPGKGMRKALSPAEARLVMAASKRQGRGAHRRPDGGRPQAMRGSRGKRSGRGLPRGLRRRARERVRLQAGIRSEAPETSGRQAEEVSGCQKAAIFGRASVRVGVDKVVRSQAFRQEHPGDRAEGVLESRDPRHCGRLRHEKDGAAAGKGSWRRRRGPGQVRAPPQHGHGKGRRRAVPLRLPTARRSAFRGPWRASSPKRGAVS